jgi:hypothetical protein
MSEVLAAFVTLNSSSSAAMSTMPPTWHDFSGSFPSFPLGPLERISERVVDSL